MTYIGVGKVHCFNVEVANQAGVEAAVVLFHLMFWAEKLGLDYVKAPYSGLLSNIPYLRNRFQLKRLLEALQEKGFIKILDDLDNRQINTYQLTEKAQEICHEKNNMCENALVQKRTGAKMHRCENAPVRKRTSGKTPTQSDSNDIWAAIFDAKREKLDVSVFVYIYNIYNIYKIYNTLKKENTKRKKEINSNTNRKEFELKTQPSPYSPPPEDFDAFWKEYPNKKGKIGARKAWDSAVKKKLLPNVRVVMNAIQKQKEWRQNAKRGEFRPEWKHPATWINQGCWDDAVEEQPSFQREERVCIDGIFYKQSDVFCTPDGEWLTKSKNLIKYRDLKERGIVE